MSNNYKNIFLLFMFLILQSCNTDTYSWLPKSADLLFISNRSGNAEIYIEHGTDTLWINLTNNEASDNWAVWSSDGEI